MEIHVLNGGALAEKFPDLNGQQVICREALIDGPVHADNFDDFFFDRAAFISETFNVPAEDYFDQVKSEYDQLATIADDATINLWFEHDLFCQGNLWFTLHFLETISKPARIFVVTPSTSASDIWSGFGKLSRTELGVLFENRVELSFADRALGRSLWLAFRKHDLETLANLRETKSQAFPLLKEVVQAHLDRFPKQGIGRPQRKLKSILQGGTTDFSGIFKKFWETEGVYGFGDTQVQRMLERL